MASEIIEFRSYEKYPHILLLACSCIPEQGSEPGTGWNHAVNAALNFETWVLCEGRASKPTITAYFEHHGFIPGLHFEYLPESLLERTLRKIPLLKYLAYKLWNRRAGSMARHLHKEHKFALVHHLTYTGFREPGYLWKLNIPFIWGPVGGAQNYPWRFLRKGGLNAILKEGSRNILNSLQLWCSPRVHRAARKAKLLLAATTTNYRAMAAALGVTPVLFPDTGIQEITTDSSQPRSDGILRILWCGMLIERKALHLLIEALACLSDHVSWELHVVGSGPLQRKWERLARIRGVDDRITWLGTIPHKESIAKYRWADIFVFTSLRDTTGTVLLEALAAGLPIICLDHQGAADVVDESCGIKIPVTYPRKVIAEIGHAIARLSRETKTRKALGQGALQRAKNYLWSEQGKRMAEIYRWVMEESK